MKSFLLAVAFAFTLGPPTIVAAQQDAVTQASSLPWVQAEVMKIDLANGRVTLRHGDIPNLDMPGMTMAFRVVDPTMLTAMKVGDAVRVSIDKVNGRLTVMRIEPAK